MSIFRRAIRLFLFIVGLISALIVGIALFVVRVMKRPPKQPLWASPEDVGLSFESVNFPARDSGPRLSGWFIPAEGASSDTPTVVFVHSLSWNRLGDAKDGVLGNLLRTRQINLLPLAKFFNQKGYNVMMFDTRGHGESVSTALGTYGYEEAYDVIGAVDYVRARPDVDDRKVAAIGFSFGANAILYALARDIDLAAAVLVQPTTPKRFFAGMFHDATGLLAPAIMLSLNVGLKLFDMPSMNSVDLQFAAQTAANVPVLFVQEASDQWGSVEEVEALAALYPGSQDLVITTVGQHRYDGFEYVIENPSLMHDFVKNAIYPK